MARSTTIVLGATAISFANEWTTTGVPNLRVPLAGLGVALIFAGVEKLNYKAGVGLSVLMMITVLVTPFNGRSPVQTLGDIGTGSAFVARNAPAPMKPIIH